MKLQIKKIIAREFLTLMTLLFTGLIIMGVTCSVNLIRSRRSTKLSIEISNKKIIADRLVNQLNQKIEAQNLFRKKVYDANYDTTGMWTKLSHLAQLDSISYYWKNIWTKEAVEFTKNFGYSSPIEFKTFIETNTIDSLDIKNNNNSISITKEVNALAVERERIESKILTFSQQFNLTLRLFTILFILLFICRYLVYGIIWSLRIIKKKSD